MNKNDKNPHHKETPKIANKDILSETTWEYVKWEITKIVWEKDYAYLLEKHIENFSLEELNYIEKLVTKHDYLLTEKRKTLINKLKTKFWNNFIYKIYDKLIKLKINDIHNKNKIKILLTDTDNNVICWKYKTCNWFWIPFWLNWEEYNTLTKIKDEDIYWLFNIDVDFDKIWIYIYWKYLNKQWSRIPFWFDKNTNKYTNLTHIEWDYNITLQNHKRNRSWKVLYWEYKNINGHIIPFWYSSEQKKYVPLKIEWENIIDTDNTKRRSKWKLISWTFINNKWQWKPFRFCTESKKYEILKIKWEEIFDTRNRKRDEKWKIISWEFLNSLWVWQKFTFKWWEYIIKKWFIKKIKSFFS